MLALILFSCSSENQSLVIDQVEIFEVVDPNTAILTNELSGDYIGAKMTNHFPFEKTPVLFLDSIKILEKGYNQTLGIELVSLDSLKLNDNSKKFIGDGNTMESETLSYIRQEGTYSGTRLYLIREVKEIWTTSSYSHNVPQGTIFYTGFYRNKG